MQDMQVRGFYTPIVPSYCVLLLDVSRNPLEDAGYYAYRESVAGQKWSIRLNEVTGTIYNSYTQV